MHVIDDDPTDRRNRKLLPGLFFLSLLLSCTHLQAKTEAPLHLGEERPVAGGKTKIADLYVGWSSYGLDFMRDPALDETVSKLNQGPYPGGGAKPDDVTFYVEIGISSEGKVTSCTLPEKSKRAAIDAHICPHLTQYARFHPALNQQGERVAAQGELYVNYSIEIVDKNAPPPPPKLVEPVPAIGPKNLKEVGPTAEITPQSLGLDDKIAEQFKLDYLSLIMDVDADGIAKSCSFYAPTFDDQMDRAICKKAKALGYTPAINGYGDPTEGRYDISFSFPFTPDQVLKPTEAAPPQPASFGEEWQDSYGRTLRARMELAWAVAEEGEGTDYIRMPAMNSKASTLDKGLYPLPKIEAAARSHAEVNIRISMDADGKPLSCSVAYESDLPALDAHVCPYVMENIRFHPPLDANGNRAAIKGVMTATYATDLQAPAYPNVPSSGEPNKRDAAPAVKITAKTLGLVKEAKAAKGQTAVLRLAIGPEGNARMCRLFAATYVDALDAQLCKKAMAVPYTGALNHKGEPTYDNIYVEMEF
jgi:hypothetical protein